MAADKQFLRLSSDCGNSYGGHVNLGRLLNRRVCAHEVTVEHDHEGGSKVHFASPRFVVSKESDVRGSVLKRVDHSAGCRRGNDRIGDTESTRQLLNKIRHGPVWESSLRIDLSLDGVATEKDRTQRACRRENFRG